jgi:hypothetical protein
MRWLWGERGECCGGRGSSATTAVRVAVAEDEYEKLRCALGPVPSAGACSRVGVAWLCARWVRAGAHVCRSGRVALRDVARNA